MGVQVAVVAPVAIVLLWVAHVYLLNQPVWRGLTYGIFWGLLVTAAVVGASRSERARRQRSSPGGTRPPGPRARDRR